MGTSTPTPGGDDDSDLVNLTLRSMQDGDQKVRVSKHMYIYDLIENHVNLPQDKRARLFCMGKELKTKEWGEWSTIEKYQIKSGMTI